MMSPADLFQAVALVGGGIVAALVLVTIVRRLFPADVLRRGHEATGNVLAIVGTLYAVLLGLVVVDAMVRFEQAEDVVQEESNCLADVFLLAARFPEPQQSRIREACRVYTRAVVDVEWPLMAQGRMSLDAREAALDLSRALDDFEPTSEAHKIVLPIVIEQVREMWDCRRERAGTVTSGIPIVEWVALIIGGAVTVLFAGLFAVDSGRLQALTTALLALVIGLNLYLVSLFGYPFAGTLSVSSRPFSVDLGIFEGLFESAPAHEFEH